MDRTELQPEDRIGGEHNQKKMVRLLRTTKHEDLSQFNNVDSFPQLTIFQNDVDKWKQLREIRLTVVTTQY